jgi:hypothetical protein
MDTDRTDLVAKMFEEILLLRGEMRVLTHEVTDLKERLKYVPEYLNITMATQRSQGEELESLRRRVHLMIGCDSSIPPATPPPTAAPPVEGA